MNDLNCLLAGFIRLLFPVFMLIFWRKRTNSRLMPAFAALAMCFPAFMIAGAIRSGFSHDDHLYFYIQQGLLYGIFEEGTKFLTMRYLLTNYDTPKDAVTYGIGHCYFEEFGGGMACLELIGTGRAASDIFIVNLFGIIEGAAFVISLTVIIFYGIQTNRSRTMLPMAMLLHAVSNMTSGIFMFSTSIVMIKSTFMTGIICFIAYRCWNTMRSSFYDNIQ